MNYLSVFIVGALITQIALADPESLKVMALFSNKAMLQINGQNHVMKIGDEIEGVTLLSAHGRAAVVRLESGKQHTLRLSQSIQHAFKKPENKTLRVYANPSGMFLLDGKINDRSTRFLIDTGATFIALSSVEANRLGLDYQSGTRGVVQTASELAPVWHIRLDRVKVGDISVPQVDAVVLQGNKPEVNLLGMSFLQHLKMQRNGAAMVIEQKY